MSFLPSIFRPPHIDPAGLDLTAGLVAVIGSGAAAMASLQTLRSAGANVRWYCRDTWGCTRRWTSHSARLASIRPDHPGKAEKSGKPGEKAEGLTTGRRVTV